jgi:ribonuclease III
VAVDYTPLYQLIGYVFQDEVLLKQALTHRSSGRLHNERLEFLGDAVINVVIAEVLYRQFPQCCEGVLSRLRSNLVKGETMAELALELGVNEFIHLSAGERKSGGRQRRSILENTLEALVGAIYLDADMMTVHHVVSQWYQDRLSEVSLDESYKDAKSRLQEVVQARQSPLPQYNIIATFGEAHARIFYVGCKVQGLNFCSTGIGASRRKAEQEAAENFLLCLESV